MTDATQPLYAQPQPRLPMAALAGATLRTFGQAPGTFMLLSVLAAAPVFASLALSPAGRGFTTAKLVTLVVKSLVLYFFQIAMTYIAVRCMDGRPFSLGEALSLAVRRYFPVLIALVLVILATMGGMILLVVPGIILAVMFAVTLPVCALEDLGPIDSMKRSMALTRDNRWRILGAFMIFFLPILILGAVIGIVTSVQHAERAGEWVNEIVQVFWMPFATIFSAALYFALRRMKGYDGVATVFD